MSFDHPALVRDLVAWVAAAPRPYADVMEAWHTSCPRLTIWEDAVDAGLVVHGPDAKGRPIVRATEAGRQFLGIDAQ